MNFTIEFLRNALNDSSSPEKIRSIVEGLLSMGYDDKYILSEIESFYKSLEDSSYEDTVLDIMDSLTGWCSPHVRIDVPLNNSYEMTEKMIVNR